MEWQSMSSHKSHGITVGMGIKLLLRMGMNVMGTGGEFS